MLQDIRSWMNYFWCVCMCMCVVTVVFLNILLNLFSAEMPPIITKYFSKTARLLKKNTENSWYVREVMWIKKYEVHNIAGSELLNVHIALLRLKMWFLKWTHILFLRDPLSYLIWTTFPRSYTIIFVTMFSHPSLINSEISVSLELIIT